jgi:curved DNA-binding protein CbpA
LQKHPDKNPDNPDAAQEFSRIQKAYDILCDSEARAALDEWLRCVRSSLLFLIVPNLS